jgi:hypothetical protein
MEESTASIFRVEEWTGGRGRGRQHILQNFIKDQTTRRHIPGDSNINERCVTFGTFNGMM